MSLPTWIQISIIFIISAHTLAQGPVDNALSPESTSIEVLQVILDLQQRYIQQAEIIGQLSTRVDVLECENDALNQQIQALEPRPMRGYEAAATGSSAVTSRGNGDINAAVITARNQCAARCTDNTDCYAFMFDTANNQCRLKVYGQDLSVSEAPSATQIRYKKQTTTCDAHLQNTQDRSKFVFVEIEGSLVKALCIDAFDGTWVFPHPESASYMPTIERDAVMLVYQSRGEGSGSDPAQYYAKFRQLPDHRDTPLQISGTPSRRTIQFVRLVVFRTLNGFTVNNHDESFSNCDTNPSSRIELVAQSNVHTRFKFTDSYYALCQRLVSKSYFSPVNEGSELNYEVFQGMNAFFGGCGGACGTNSNEAEVDRVALGIRSA